MKLLRRKVHEINELNQESSGLTSKDSIQDEFEDFKNVSFDGFYWKNTIFIILNYHRAITFYCILLFIFLVYFRIS